MKVQIKNLGPLKQAEFTLGDLTIICGLNNTGKTYATYALFGFLSLRNQVFTIPIKEEELDHLFAEGTTRLDLTTYIAQAEHILQEGCLKYTEQLPTVFAASSKRFEQTKFQIQLNSNEIHLLDHYEQSISSGSAELFSITKGKGSTELVVTLLGEKSKIGIPKEVVGQFISDALKEILFRPLFPNPFIVSAERTGAVIFRKELNFARNRLLEEISKADKKVDPIRFLFKVYQDYALPVKINVDFTRELEALAKRSSFIAEKHPDLLRDFADIIGGEYTVTENDELYYLPKSKRGVKLSMDESSSAVRSLLDIGFYLRHVVQQDDLLMVDEPELNLHPENQRRVARLFARLINIGIKVFITTHSDYIIKELNTLIMLNNDKPHLRQIAEKEGYKQEELLSVDKIKVYIAEDAPVKLDGMQRKTRCSTLTPADIDPQLGIEARSFDVTIDTMNRIQEEIIWGEK